MSSGLVAIFSWKTRKNSTNGSMGNKKFAKKFFCHTPSMQLSLWRTLPGCMIYQIVVSMLYDLWKLLFGVGWVVGLGWVKPSQTTLPSQCCPPFNLKVPQ